MNNYKEKLDRLHESVMSEGSLKDIKGRPILGGVKVKIMVGKSKGKTGFMYNTSPDGKEIRVTSKPQTGLIGWYKPEELSIAPFAKESLSPLDALHESVCKEAKFKTGDKIKFLDNNKKKIKGVINYPISGTKLYDVKVQGGTHIVYEDEIIGKESFSPLDALHESVFGEGWKKDTSGHFKYNWDSDTDRTGNIYVTQDSDKSSPNKDTWIVGISAKGKKLPKTRFKTEQQALKFAKDYMSKHEESATPLDALHESVAKEAKWNGKTDSGSRYAFLRAKGLSHDKAVKQIETESLSPIDALQEVYILRDPEDSKHLWTKHTTLIDAKQRAKQSWGIKQNTWVFDKDSDMYYSKQDSDIEIIKEKYKMPQFQRIEELSKQKNSVKVK